MMKFQKKRLKNGMTVLFERRELPLVSVSITNPFGAVYETSKIKGIAHFIEHLVFTGTKTRTHEDISREIEKKGGILNAFTAQDVTSFWFKLPSEHLFSGLDILTDIMSNPIFERGKFEKEKKVVIEEIKMYHDNPARYVHEMIEQNLYAKPLGEGIAGSVKTLSALDRDFVANYFNETYTTEDYIVTVVGNADLNKICFYLEEKFSLRKRLQKKQKIVLHNKNSVEKRPGIDQAHFVFAVHAPMMNTREHLALQVLDAYLANGMSSQLFLEIREKRGLAYTVKGSISTEKNYSYYSIYVGTTKEAVPEVKKLILGGFAAVDKMNEKNLREAQEMLIGLNRVQAEESSNVMNELMYSELTGKAEDYYNYEKKIRAVTLAEVKKMAKIGKYSTAAVLPK